MRLSSSTFARANDSPDPPVVVRTELDITKILVGRDADIDEVLLDLVERLFVGSTS
jgi:hypothetical protein